MGLVEQHRSEQGFLAQGPIAWRTVLTSPVALLVVGFIVVLWLVGVIGRVLWNGYVYDLAYTLWYPDGVNYSYRAFIAAGIEPEIATQWLNEMYPDVEGGIPPGMPPAPESVNSRVMFVLLSAPFVRVFGMYGLLVAPSLGLLVATLTPALMLIRRGLWLSALIGSSLLLASTSMLRWSTANLTEGIMIGLFALMLPLLPWGGRLLRLRSLLALAALAIAISLTRQSFPLLVGLVTPPMLLAIWGRHANRREWVRAAIALVVPSVLIFLFTNPRTFRLFVPAAQDTGAGKEMSISQRILNFPVDFVRMTVVEIGQLAVLDRALLLLLLAAMLVAALRPISELSLAWLGSAAVGFFLTAWVGAGGVNFRYSMQLATLSVLLVSSTWPPSLGRRLDSLSFPLRGTGAVEESD
jgi:hypothetical protein